MIPPLPHRTFIDDPRSCAHAGSEKVYDNFMQIVVSIDFKSASQMCALLHSAEVLLVGALVGSALPSAQGRVVEQKAESVDIPASNRLPTSDLKFNFAVGEVLFGARRITGMLLLVLLPFSGEWTGPTHSASI